MYELETKRIMTTQSFLNSLLFTTQLKWNKSTHCSVHLHCLLLILECSNWSTVINEQFKNYSRSFKDAGKCSRTTRWFWGIKDITSFDGKFKDSPWRSRTSGNLRRSPPKDPCGDGTESAWTTNLMAKLEMMHILEAHVWSCISAYPGLPHQKTKREASDALKSQLNEASWNRTVLKFGSVNQLNVRNNLSTLFCDFRLIARSG